MEHLQELCQDLHLDSNLKKSDEGFFLLPLNPSLQIGVKFSDPGAIFTSPIAPCPELKQEELLTLLMKANLFGQGTLGSAIGLDPEQNLLTLSLNLPYDMNYRAFRENLEDFANIVDYWREEVKEHIQRARSEIL